MAPLGFLLVAAVGVVYLVTAFVVRRTIATRIYDVVAILGGGLGVAGWAVDGSRYWAFGAIGLALVWFVLSRWELALPHGDGLRVGIGDRLPAFAAVTSEGAPFDDSDLIAAAPAVLILYRGWWCPYCNTQLERIRRDHDLAQSGGVSVFAMSVDPPEESALLQERLGGAVRILSDPDGSLLDAVGVRHRDGIPWYDRLLSRVPRRDVSFPATLAIDDDGVLRYVHRSPRIDIRPRLEDAVVALERIRKA